MDQQLEGDDSSVLGDSEDYESEDPLITLEQVHNFARQISISFIDLETIQKLSPEKKDELKWNMIVVLERLEKLVVAYDALAKEKSDLEDECKQQVNNSRRFGETIKTLEQFIEEIEESEEKLKEELRVLVKECTKEKEENERLKQLFSEDSGNIVSNADVFQENTSSEDHENLKQLKEINRALRQQLALKESELEEEKDKVEELENFADEMEDFSITIKNKCLKLEAEIMALEQERDNLAVETEKQRLTIEHLKKMQDATTSIKRSFSRLESTGSTRNQMPIFEELSPGAHLSKVTEDASEYQPKPQTASVLEPEEMSLNQQEASYENIVQEFEKFAELQKFCAEFQPALSSSVECATDTERVVNVALDVLESQLRPLECSDDVVHKFSEFLLTLKDRAELQRKRGVLSLVTKFITNSTYSVFEESFPVLAMTVMDVVNASLNFPRMSTNGTKSMDTELSTASSAENFNWAIPNCNYDGEPLRNSSTGLDSLTEDTMNATAEEVLRDGSVTESTTNDALVLETRVKSSIENLTEEKHNDNESYRENSSTLHSSVCDETSVGFPSFGIGDGPEVSSEKDGDRLLPAKQDESNDQMKIDSKEEQFSQTVSIGTSKLEVPERMRSSVSADNLAADYAHSPSRTAADYKHVMRDRRRTILGEEQETVAAGKPTAARSQKTSYWTKYRGGGRERSVSTWATTEVTGGDVREGRMAYPSTAEIVEQSEMKKQKRSQWYQQKQITVNMDRVQSEKVDVIAVSERVKAEAKPCYTAEGLLLIDPKDPNRPRFTKDELMQVIVEKSELAMEKANLLEELQMTKKELQELRMRHALMNNYLKPNNPPSRNPSTIRRLFGIFGRGARQRPVIGSFTGFHVHPVSNVSSPQMARRSDYRQRAGSTEMSRPIKVHEIRLDDKDNFRRRTSLEDWRKIRDVSGKASPLCPRVNIDTKHGSDPGKFGASYTRRPSLHPVDMDNDKSVAFESPVD